MNIIARGTINYYNSKYPQAKTALLTWYHEFIKKTFRNFNELKQVYGNASIVSNNRVIFNIKGNDFRLVTSINFRQQAAYVIWFGTHGQYDKINVEAIEFDIDILNKELCIGKYLKQKRNIKWPSKEVWKYFMLKKGHQRMKNFLCY